MSIRLCLGEYLQRGDCISFVSKFLIVVGQRGFYIMVLGKAFGFAYTIKKQEGFLKRSVGESVL
jgi:hypothetical protein